MLREVLSGSIEIIRAMAVTLKYLFKPPVTNQFPNEAVAVYPRFRGRHVLKRYDNGLERCIGCSLCAAACPTDCILVVAGENTDEKRYSPGERYGKVYEINLLRCIFCGYCAEACPTEAIVLEHDFALATYNRWDAIITREELLQPHTPDYVVVRDDQAWVEPQWGHGVKQRISESTSRQGEVKMTKREIVRLVLEGKRPPYVPWSFGFTQEAFMTLQQHFGQPDLEDLLQNHLLDLGNGIGFFTGIGDDCVRDVFGVVWDRSVDKDIGVVRGCVLPKPTLKGYNFPDPLDPRFFEDIPEKIGEFGDRFRVFQIGFSLYERAWTLRGMQTLMMDFYDHPEFVHDLLNAIADYNIAQIEGALKYDIDAIYFGDDWGQQRGLQMGPLIWREFLYPPLKRMYGAVRQAGKFVFIHSCGDVDELFDDLIGIGLNCFNPFQPEVMDVVALMKKYRGRLAFHGGLSTQQTLPYGSVDDVRRETRQLLELGREGGYIFAPAHAVEGDVPLENMLAFIEVVQQQPRYRGV